MRKTNKLNRKKNKKLLNRKKPKQFDLNQKGSQENKNKSAKVKLQVQNVEKNCDLKSPVINEKDQRQQRAKDLRDAQNSRRLKLQLEKRGLEDLVDEATQKDKDFERNPQLEKEREIKSNSTNFKSYFKELKTVIEAADIILEVLDSRDPLGSRSTQIEEMVVSSGKKLVLVLNKIDLIPRSNLDSWLTYLRRELPTVAFKASTQSQNSNLSQSKVAAIHINENLQNSSTCVGASFLMKMLGNYCRNQNIQTFIKVGVVGFPNVGKSSVINSLKRCRSCSVGATAGVTKSVQEVSLDKHIKILDSPGVVFAKDGPSPTLALRNALKIETLKDVISPAEAIFQRADSLQLRNHYNVSGFSSCHEFLSLLAKRTGKYKKGGVPHVEEAAKKLINDWNRGVIKYYTHPPEEQTSSLNLDACFVSAMSKAFDISSLEEQMELDKISETCSSNSTEKPALVNAKESLEKMDADNIDASEKLTVVLAPKQQLKKKDPESEFSMDELQKNRALKKKFKQMKRNRKRQEEKRRLVREQELVNENLELDFEENELKKEEENLKKLNQETNNMAATIESLTFN